jgi:hypothetical protein
MEHLAEELELGSRQASIAYLIRCQVHSSPGLLVSARHGRYGAEAIGRLMKALKSEQEAYGCAK